MILVEQMKDFKIYKTKMFLPTVSDNKKKNTAIIMMTPNYASSKNIMNHPLFVNQRRYESYFLDRDVSYYIGGKNLEEVDESFLYLNETKRSNLNDNQFGIPEDRKYPLDTRQHVLSAIKLFGHAEEGKKHSLARRIARRAKYYGIDIPETTQVYKYLHESITEGTKPHKISKCKYCGGNNVKIEINGEPIYRCMDCMKYLGTVPFNEFTVLNEATNVDTIIFDIGSVLTCDDGVAQTLLDIGIPEDKHEEYIHTFWEQQNAKTTNDNCDVDAALKAYLLKFDEEDRDTAREAFKAIATSCKPFEYTMPLIIRLKEQGKKLYYLSNWDRVSWELSKEAGNFDFLKEFNDGIVSWEVGFEKPGKEIYELFKEKFKDEIDFSRAVFFDDKEKNVKGARECGITSFIWNIMEGPNIPEYLNSIREVAGEVELKEDIDKSILKLNKDLNSWKYGVVINGKPETDIDKINWMSYKTIPIDQMEKHEVGICWDFVNYEYKWFKDHKVPCEAYFFVMQKSRKEDDIVTHTFIVFNNNGKKYWFESSWAKHKGIHPVSGPKDVADKLVEYYGDHNYSIYKYNPEGLDKNLPNGKFFQRATKNLVKNHVVNESADMENVSDGNHTFAELYEQRAVLLATLANLLKDKSWKTWKQYDGTMPEGYFLMGIDFEEEYQPVRFHIKADMWDLFKIPELPYGPRWDGSTPEDCVRYLRAINCKDDAVSEAINALLEAVIKDKFVLTNVNNQDIKFLRKYDRNNDITIKAGKVVCRLSGSPKEDLRNKRLYVSLSKYDHLCYISTVISDGISIGGDKDAPYGYSLRYKIKRDIKIPSYDNMILYFLDTVNHFGLDKISNYMDRGNDYPNSYETFITYMSNVHNEANLNTAYSIFIANLIKDNEMSKYFFNSLKSGGYSAIIDENDYRFGKGFTNAPLIIIDAASYLTLVGYTKITVSTIDLAQICADKGYINKNDEFIKKYHLKDLEELFPKNLQYVSESGLEELNRPLVQKYYEDEAQGTEWENDMKERFPFLKDVQEDVEFTLYT